MAKPSFLLGVCSAFGVIFIWSGFIVFSRAGVTTNLTAFDLAALRFAVAGALVLPFLRAWWPSHLPLKAKLIMAVCGPGAVYSVLLYLGLNEASAAYGGAFANGSLPVFTMLLLVLLSGERPRRSQLLAAVILFALAAIHLGPTATAGFSAAVPATAALLAVAVLSETPNPMEWIGIATVTAGLTLLIARR